MSEVTIQCRLVASEETLRYLWELMAQKNTPLINELLEQLGRHSDLEAWLKIGKVPTVVIKALCDSLKTQERFAGQPGRFYSSAIALVEYTYKSWIALQQRRQRQIEGKERWLTMLKSDRELEQESNCSLDAIRNKAREILIEISANCGQIQNQQTKSKKKTKKSKSERATATLFDTLFKAYIDTEDPFTRCALAYLLKNNCQASELEEDPDRYALRRRKKEIEIERLRKQLKSRIPKGRDLTGEKWLGTLETATRNVPIDEDEAKSWQASLLRKSSNVPFPVAYETSEDMIWFGKLQLNNIPINLYFFRLWLDIVYLITTFFLFDSLQAEKQWFNKLRFSNSKLTVELWSLVLGINCLSSILFLHGSFDKYKRRICVQFNGLGKHPCEIYCDFRHLHWFQRFLEDRQIKHDNKNQYSSGLFTLRSGRIVWQKGEGKGEPWKIHRLSLHCCIDTRLWTAQGTKLVAEEKAEEIAKAIAKTRAKGDLNQKQLAHIQRKNSSLARIDNPFPRPSKPIYQGQSHILVGVSLGLKKLATIAVVDASTGQVITYRSIKQLLGDNYNLLNRQQQQQQRLSHKRHKAQKRNAPISFGESELGKYVDRLLADAIVAIAQTYSAGSIVLPQLKGMREQVSSEIQALAEKRVPGYQEGQEKYAQQYRASVHHWSYGRLMECIQSFAAKAGIAIEVGQQPVRGSPQEKARDLAFFAYHSREIAVR